MLHSPVTISIAFVRGMVSGIDARGLPFEPLLARAGIPAELLQQNGARVTADQYVAVFKSLIEHFDDECMGFLSRPIRRGSLALMARSAIGTPTLAAALRRIAHTFRLLQDDVALELVRDGAQASVALRFNTPSVAQAAFLHELLLRVFWRLLAWLAGGSLPATGFDFAFARPSYAASYGKAFPAPLRFDAAQTAFRFDAALLQQPVRRDESAVRSFLADAQAQIIVPRRPDDLFSARVRDHLQSTLPQWPDLFATAEALNVSASTLQRRLAREGVSFQSLKDELRRDMAIVRLNTGTLSLTALAFELGFTDSAGFQRAFKGWTGSAPGTYRRGSSGSGSGSVSVSSSGGADGPALSR